MSKSKMCIVAHPQMQHSMKVALALKKQGILQTYQTMQYYGKGRIATKIYDLMSQNGSVSRFTNRCKESKLDLNDVKTHTVLGGFLLELLARVDKSGRIYYDYYVWITGRFAKRVAQDAIKNKAKLVVMYDFTAKKCFEYLNNRNSSIIKVLDMSSLPTKTIDGIISKEEEAGYGSLFELKRKRYSKKRCNYYGDEITLADYFLSPSRSVTDALVELNIDINRIIQVPFGVDHFSFTNKERQYNQDTKLHFLFVGRMEAAKGICYLLQAFDKLSEERSDFVLELVGAACGNDDLLKREYVKYYGVVSKNEMIDIYRRADVFVFPSLWEGCSLSLMEAMASGLPVIATRRSGIKEFLHGEDEGFCIEESDYSQILYYARWYLEHKKLIPEMGQKAANSIRQYSWDNYYQTVGLAINELVNR